jgi:hypothetical protein
MTAALSSKESYVLKQVDENFFEEPQHNRRRMRADGFTVTNVPCRDALRA